ncbi:MAG: hypothetical protein ABEJ46_02735, partial [Gemmatimonadota bacterium]
LGLDRRRARDAVVADIYRMAAGAGSGARTVEAVLGVPRDTLTRRWHDAVREAYGPVREVTDSASAFGTPLVTREGAGGSTNVAPSLSPDGERVIFLSERSLFSMEMYLADAETGEVLRRVTRTAVDPHY